MAAAAAIVVAAGLTWAVFGSIPTRAFGQGVLLADGKASHTVQPIVAGRVVDLLVKRGDHVEAHAVVARIQQVSLDTRLASTNARIAVMKRDLARMKKAHAAELAKNQAALGRQKAAVQEQVSAGTIRAERLKEILKADEGLLARGLVSQLEVANARAQHDHAALDVANAKARKIEIEVAITQRRDNMAEIERQKQEDIDALQADAAQLRAEIEIGSSLRAPVSGVIEEVRVGQGDVVAPGTIVATIGRTSPQSYEVIAMFSNDMAKRVRPGMDVHVKPVSVKKEEHGTMRGRVRLITELSVSKAEVNAILRNPQLTDSLMGESPPLLSRIEVFLDKETPSGFAWWGGRGPPFSITPGTRVDVEVIVDRQRPIVLVIPALRDLVGLEG